MLPRAPFSAFDGERLPGIGHNQGPPLDGAQSFRRFAWKKARAELMPRLPLEVLRRRVARAKALGLAYPAYASILMGTGRDIVGFLFTCDAIGLRLSRTVALPDHVRAKLAGLESCEKLLMSKADEDPLALARRLAAETRIAFANATRPPSDAATPVEVRKTFREVLEPLKLASDTIVMIGTRARERDWADAANLARFLPAERYFAP